MNANLHESIDMTEEDIVKWQEDLKQQVREAFVHLYDVEGVPVYTNHFVSLQADIEDLVNGFATQFDVEDNGEMMSIIVLSEAAAKLSYEEIESLLYHELGHIVLGHIDEAAAMVAEGNEYTRNLQHELEADAFSYAKGKDIMSFLLLGKEQATSKLKELEEEFPEIYEECSSIWLESLAELDIRIDAINSL